MSERSEENGSSFRSVQDRLKMFEQKTPNTTKFGYKKISPEINKTNQKPMTSTLNVPSTNNKKPTENSTYRKNDMFKGIQTEKLPTSPKKSVFSTERPPVKKVPPAVPLREDFPPPLEFAAVSQNKIKTPNQNNSPLPESVFYPPPPNCLPANSSSKANVTIASKPFDFPPPAPLPSSSVTPDTKSPIALKEDSASIKISKFEKTRNKDNVPDHISLGGDKTKVTIDTKIPDLTPSIPSPPPCVTKVKSNSLVGWVKTSNTKAAIVPEKVSTTETVTKDDKAIKTNYANIPPPILAPPPSSIIYENVKKVNKKSMPRLTEEEPCEEDIARKPWYFDISKAEATELMSSTIEIGTFIVRPSDDEQYVLMIRAKDDVVKKFKIQYLTTGWILGDPTKCKRVHPSICSLMDFYCQNGVKVGNKILKLTEPVSK